MFTSNLWVNSVLGYAKFLTGHYFFFFFTMRLKPANLKSEDFKYVGPAKKNFFKQNQQGG